MDELDIYDGSTLDSLLTSIYESQAYLEEILADEALTADEVEIALKKKLTEKLDEYLAPRLISVARLASKNAAQTYKINADEAKVLTAKAVDKATLQALTYIDNIVNDSMPAFSIQVAKNRTQAATAKQISETFGLTDKQQRSILTFRQELERISEGKAKEINTRLLKFLGASQRSQLSKYLDNPTELKKKKIDKLIDNTKKSMVYNRSKAIATNINRRTYSQIEEDMNREAVKNGLIQADEYRRFWITRHDDKVRYNHTLTESMNSNGVGLLEPFKTPLGYTMSPPLEINCRCRVMTVKGALNG